MGISENKRASEQKKLEEFFRLMQNSWSEFTSIQQKNQEALRAEIKAQQE